MPHPVAKLSDIPNGTTKRVEIDGQEVLLCNCDGEIYAIEDVCTHDGGPLDQGEVIDCRVICPRHGAMFDIKTGAALTPPAVVPLETYRVRIEGDEIYVEA